LMNILTTQASLNLRSGLVMEHIDGNLMNNEASNIRLVDPKENRRCK
jgi:hypothetical protein